MDTVKIITALYCTFNIYLLIKINVILHCTVDLIFIQNDFKLYIQQYKLVGRQDPKMTKSKSFCER